jgi:hypothetical protein
MPSALFFALSKRRRKSLAIVCVCVVLNVFLGLMLPKLPESLATESDSRILQQVWQPPHPFNSSQRQLPPQQQQDRPVMYTFFTTLTRRKHTELNPAGMSNEAHTRMLSVWSKAWWEAGWYPVILTMADAQKHKQFEEINEIMETFKMNSYNLACFYRWIAMAAVGGGWMSGMCFDSSLSSQAVKNVLTFACLPFNMLFLLSPSLFSFKIIPCWLF